ncbi:ankyrin repeat domain-containing protein [Kibdelosporangium aridum]|uniref:Ankyrin repeat domain-containing protein n=1 Tax=Kibdelosporangium aridum TaxID=2030 RepID=A0A428Z452_KIBAR|nr:ankyrin repeat domain-containing protein [Kibdelosporangium aridum]RSM80981.1 ankyrin repeat domain-containing protein [Kibdelosporangium aridum]
MLACPLPAKPSLEQLRKQAKQLRDHVRTGDPRKGTQTREARDMAREWHPRWAGTSPDATEWAGFTLADAQLVIARKHGFPSWRQLHEYLDMVARYGRSPQRRPASRPGGGADLVDEFLRLACLTNCSSWQFGAGEEPDNPRRQTDARRLLAAHPRLASATIHTAAAVGDVAAARSLLAADASLANQEGGPHGWPPLLYLAFSRLDSAEANHSTLKVARLLLTHGADPNAGYLPDGEPPPVTALSGTFHGRSDPVNNPAHQYSLPLARLLLDAGADPNDRQAVSNACQYPHDDAGLALLLDHGLGRRSNGPWPARLGNRRLTRPARMLEDQLRYAAEWNLIDRVRLLLRYRAATGIDVNAAADTPDACKTAYEIAMVGGNTEIVDLLIRAGAQATPLAKTYQLVGACLRVDRPAVDRLLADDPDLVQRAMTIPWWPHPLHHAAALGRLEAVALLVSLGFEVEKRLASPLHTAALFGHIDVVRLLVELGADPTAEATDDNTTGTPLSWARYNHQHEVVAYLTHLTSAVPNPPANSAT